jgi:hypothetical protein
MKLNTLLAEWADRCRELARLARDDAERSATYDAINPDETVRLVRREPETPDRKP